MSNSFNLMDTNPNVPSGSNGCLCHPLGGPDTAGPFVAFIGTETDNILAPYPVLCAHCAAECEMLVKISEGGAVRRANDAHVERTGEYPPSAPPASPRKRRPNADHRVGVPREPTHAKRSVDDADGPSI